MTLQSGITNTNATQTANEPLINTQPVKAATPSDLPATQSWTLEGDPMYQDLMKAGKSQFNYNQFNALAQKQNTATDLIQQGKENTQDTRASLKRLAGNYAARGMAGGAFGALTYAENEAKAREFAARLTLSQKLDALDTNYRTAFGAAGTDWRGTLQGQAIQGDATQQAILARLQAIGANQ